MRNKRVTVTIDADVYDYLRSQAGRRGLTMAQTLRWIMRDGVVHRMDLDRQYRALEVEAKKYGG